MVLSEAGVIGQGAAIPIICYAIDAIKPTAVIMLGIALGIDHETLNLGEIIISKLIQSYESQKIRGVVLFHVEIAQEPQPGCWINSAAVTWSGKEFRCISA